MSNVYSEKQLDHYLEIMDRVAELWLQKFPERAAYSPGYWHLFMGLYKNRKRNYPGRLRVPMQSAFTALLRKG